MSVTEGSRRKQRTPGEAKGPKGRPRTTPETENALRRAAINVFILFHLIAITCVAVPVDFSPLKNVRELVDLTCYGLVCSKDGTCLLRTRRRSIPT